MMTSKIVISNNISESEKLKSLASFGEINFDLRFMTPYHLAEYLLQLSGTTYKEAFIKNDRLSAELYNDIKKIDYFKKFSYLDILGLIETLLDVRYHILDDEDSTFISLLPTDQFIKKNQALKQVFELIKNYLKDNNLIDEVGVIRFAIKNIKPVKDIEIIKYEKSHLKPLENYLLDVACGKHLEEAKINKVDKPLNIVRYTKAFGQSNEIEDILSYIYKNNIKFDDCVIASASGSNYANVLKNYRDLLGFPLTIGLGTPVLETSPGKLYTLVNEWESNFYHKDLLKAIFDSDSFNLENFKKDIEFPDDLTEINQDLSKNNQISFDELITIVGDLKVSFDEKKNYKKLADYESLLNKYVLEKYNEEDALVRVKTLPFLKSIIEVFNKGKSNFIESYSVLKDIKQDSGGLGKILLGLSFKKYGVTDLDIEKAIKEQVVPREQPQQGTLYYTSISKAVSCLRKHLFIVGLSSNNFPGKNTENPIMLDRDYKAFGEQEYSTRGIRNNKDDYFVLLEEAKKYNVNVYLSWSSYNEETLKSQNSSSVVFETYKLENSGDKTINDFEKEFNNKSNKYRYIEYFEDELLPINAIGKAVTENKEVACTPIEGLDDLETLVPFKKMLESNYAFSASAVTNYAKCPYMFYLQNILGLQSKKEIDLTEIIPANDSGTLAHELLEHLNKKTTSLEDFVKEAELRFNEYLIFHPTENTSLADLARKDFSDMMSNAYEMEQDVEVEIAEKDFYCTHKESGVRIHGLPDKIIKFTNGHSMVVDYKTGNRVKHDADDVASMIQCTIYSYVFEHYKKGDHVDAFEYRYIRTGDSVFSGDNGHTMLDHYNNLTETLKNLKVSLETGNFEPNTKHCGDCYMKDYCRKKK